MQRMLSTKKKKCLRKRLSPIRQTILHRPFQRLPDLPPIQWKILEGTRINFRKLCPWQKLQSGYEQLMAVVRSISTCKLETIPRLLQEILVNTALNPQLTAVGNNFYFKNSSVSIMSNTREIEYNSEGRKVVNIRTKWCNELKVTKASIRITSICREPLVLNQAHPKRSLQNDLNHPHSDVLHIGSVARKFAKPMRWLRRCQEQYHGYIIIIELQLCV